MRRIGVMKNGLSVVISDDAPNKNLCMFGKSGVGKSTRITEIVNDVSATGETVICFDLDGTVVLDELKNYTLIDALQDGLNLKLLQQNECEIEDNYVTFISYITKIIAETNNFGVRQIGALRSAIEYAVEHQSEYETEMDAIVRGLILQDSTVANGVYNRLWAVLNCNVFRRSVKQIRKGKVNVISLKGIDSDTQRTILEIMLGAIWKKFRLSKERTCPLTIVLDEFQKLNLKKDSIFTEMLREARKYGVTLILATQSADLLKKEVLSAIHQTGVQMYFQLGAIDAKKVSEIIGGGNSEHYLLQLKNLKKGESLVVGNVSVGGKEMFKPIVIRSQYEDKVKARKSNTTQINQIGMNR